MRTTITLMTALALAAAVHAEDKKPGIPEVQRLMERARDAKEAGRHDEARELAEKARQIGEANHREGKPGADRKAPEPFEKARHQIEELHRAGKHEEAERLKHHVAEEMERRKGAPEAGDKGMPERLAKARHEIEELHRAGKHEEAQRLERRVAGAMAGRPGDGAKEGDGPAKLRHLMEAIHHLREAGLNEPAESLEKLAHKMHEELEHREREHARPAPGDDKARRPEQPAHPPGDELRAMREQMEKMARAIEELRAQVKARGGEEVRKPGN